MRLRGGTGGIVSELSLNAKDLFVYMIGTFKVKFLSWRVLEGVLKDYPVEFV